MDRINYEAYVAYHKITGERISGPEPITFADLTYTHPNGTQKTIKFHRHNRPKFIAALFTQLKNIGVDMEFGKRAIDYIENEATQKAGVILEDGSKLEADVVIAADGVGTKSYKIVSGHDIRAYPSGFSILRTAFPIELATEDPDIANRWPLFGGVRPVAEMWQG
jgi:flavin-dependent dehydrogenase